MPCFQLKQKNIVSVKHLVPKLNLQPSCVDLAFWCKVLHVTVSCNYKLNMTKNFFNPYNSAYAYYACVINHRQAFIKENKDTFNRQRLNQENNLQYDAYQLWFPGLRNHDLQFSTELCSYNPKYNSVTRFNTSSVNQLNTADVSTLAVMKETNTFKLPVFYAITTQMLANIRFFCQT